MTGLILTIRPEPGCAATVSAASKLGLAIECYPLFEIVPLAWEPIDPDAFDGLLLGSANAIRHAGSALAQLRGLPAHVVGQATAAAAVAEGFTVATIGPGQLQPLVDSLPVPSRLLRLTGAEHVPVTPPAGISIETRVAYDSVPKPLPQPLAAMLREGALVLLHSAAAARHFAGECQRLAIDRKALRLAALGPRIASAAGAGWGEARAAAEPSEPALLALAVQMCHEPRLR